MEGAMNNREAPGSWIRRFLMEYLVGERNLARNTQQSYRDAIRLLVVFTAPNPDNSRSLRREKPLLLQTC